MASDHPRVCVVVPLLNEAKYLRESMDSLMTQDYPSVEVVAYDAGSIDDTLDILRAYPVEVHVEPGLSQMAAINRGWRQTTAEFVTWWAGDDRYRPGAIKRLVSELVSHPEACLVHGSGCLIDENGDVIGRSSSRSGQLRELVMDFRILPQATLIRRKCLERSGMMDESRRLAADWDLFLRLAQYFPLHFAPFAAADRRMHSDSEDAKGVEAAGEACMDIMDRFFERPDLTDEQRALKKYGLVGSRVRASWHYAVVGKRRRAIELLLEAVRAGPSVFCRADCAPSLGLRLLLPSRLQHHLTAVKRIYYSIPLPNTTSLK